MPFLAKGLSTPMSLAPRCFISDLQSFEEGRFFLLPFFVGLHAKKGLVVSAETV